MDLAHRDTPTKEHWARGSPIFPTLEWKPRPARVDFPGSLPSQSCSCRQWIKVECGTPGIHIRKPISDCSQVPLLCGRVLQDMCSMRPILVATLFLSAVASQMPAPLIIRPAVFVSVAASQAMGQQAAVSFGQPLARQHFMFRGDHLTRRSNGQVGSPLLRNSAPQQPSPVRAPQPQPAPQQQFSNQPVQPAPQRFNNQLAGSRQAQPSLLFDNQQPRLPQAQSSLLFSNQKPRLPQAQPSQPQPINSQNSQSRQTAPQKVNQPAGSPQTQPLQPIRNQAGSPLRQPAQQVNNQQPSLSQAQPSRQQFDSRRTGGSQQPQSAGHVQRSNATSPQFAARPAGRHFLCGVIPDPGECRAAFPRYYFNTQTNQCDCFLYGGCGDEGLESSYSTLNECRATCLPAIQFEGPNCKKVFQDDDILFEPAASLPSLPAPSITSGTAPGAQPALPARPDSENGASQNKSVTQQTAGESVSVASNQHTPGKAPTNRHTLCGKMPSPGTCRGAFPRYYYNETNDQCDCFLYGGCGDEGLESSYATLAECLRVCLPQETLEGPACKEVFQDDQEDFEPLASKPRPTPGQSSSVDTSNIADEDLLGLFGR
nr:POU domain, class 6, transcription factor 2-like [Penaeus vannamei]